jgi:hypothetical protein
VSKPDKLPASKLPDSTELAWRLAGAVRPYLDNLEADRIYIAIGVGEAFEAIEALITAITRRRVPIREELAVTVNTWLDCHRGHDAEPQLRKAIARAKTYRPQPIPTKSAGPDMARNAHGATPQRDSL